MKRTSRTLALAMTLVVAGAVLQADVKVQDKHQVKIAGALGKLIGMFAGKSLREPTLGTTAIKGDRKLTIYGDYGQIVDLQEEKIYTLDVKNKSYKVRTFEEARKAARELREKAQQQQAKQKPDTDKTEKKPDQQAPEYEIDVTSKPTGQTKSINGFDTKQVITTVAVRQKGKTLDEGGGLLVTVDSWVAPKIDALKERAEFEKRYIAKMADEGPASSDVPPETMAAAASMYPMLADAMKRAHVEGEKVDGTPIMTTMNIDGVADPSAPQDDSSTTSNDQPTTPSGLGGFLAKKMMKKNKDKESEQGSGDAEALPKGHSRIMTIYQEVQSVTTDVAAADVAMPEGFKEK